ncbi:hypothetical protein [Sulfurimonas crateris]|nr:hypothetical protein [Sulfurimonas crateris]
MNFAYPFDKTARIYRIADKMFALTAARESLAVKLMRRKNFR